MSETKLVSRMRAVAVLAVLGALGCERADPRLEGLTIGIGKDSALAVMQAAPNKLEPYLINGLYIEGMFYARPGKTDSASLAPRKMTPVVAVNGKVTGWGWDHWDSVAAANRIPVAPKP
ncbi:MAG: hypothetical protein FJ206_09705 [Gemmatimonadetes bacterium]|nr:hypothetical protein [Gemmatimonadota bacterium]